MSNNNKKIIIILFVIFLILGGIFLFGEKSYAIDWQNFKAQNLKEVQNDISLNKEIRYKYNLAIAYANLGEINNSQKTLDEIEDKFGKKEFKKVIYPYIKQINYKFADSINKNSDRIIENNSDRIIINNNSSELLELNYAAFYYLIFENYSRSSSYFKEIVKRDLENIWALNYLAGNYIMLEEFDKAENYLIKADNIKNNKFTNLLYGYIYYEKGNYIRAFAKLSQTGDLLKEKVFQ